MERLPTDSPQAGQASDTTTSPSALGSPAPAGFESPPPSAGLVGPGSASVAPTCSHSVTDLTTLVSSPTDVQLRPLRAASCGGCERGGDGGMTLVSYMDDGVQTGSDLYRFSFHFVPDWLKLPHFHYRRIMHDYFANLHLYHPKWLPRGSSIAAGCNVIASTWGIGTLTMCYAALQCGVVYFVVGAVLIMSFTVATQYLMCRAVDITNLHSFEMITRHVFGSRVPEVAVEVLVVANCFGVSIAYLVIVGDVAERIVTGMIASSSMPLPTVRILSMLAVFLCFMLPLSMMRTMRALQYASAVSLVAMTAVSVFTVVNGYEHASVDNLKPLGLTSFFSFSTGTSLLLFGFSNQVNTVEIYSEVEKRSPRGFCKITLLSMVFVALVYLLVGTAGLAQFGSIVEGNILKSIHCDSVFSLIAMIGVVAKVTLSFPLVVFPTREAMLHMVGVHDTHTVSTVHFVATTAGITSSAFIVAIFLPNITALLGLLGAVCVGMFAFILPAVIVWKLPEYWAPLDGTAWCRYAPLHKAGCVLSVVFGVAVSIAGTIAALKSYAT